MSKGKLAVIGVALSLASFVLLVSSFSMLSLYSASPSPQEESDRQKREEAKNVPTNAPSCELKDVKASSKTISDEKNLGLTVSLSPAGSKVGCRDTVVLDAPNFKTNAKEKDVAVPPVASTSNGKAEKDKMAASTKEFSWNLNPQETGQAKIGVTTNKGSDYAQVTVENELDVTKLLIDTSQILSGLGVLLGPVLTIPWWFDKLRGRRSGG